MSDNAKTNKGDAPAGSMVDMQRRIAELEAENRALKAAPPATVDAPIESEMGTEEIDDGMEDVINVSGQEVKFNIGNGRVVKLKPTQHTKIERLYALPQQGASKNGDPVPAVIEMMTDGRVVAARHRKARSFYKNLAARKAQLDQLKAMKMAPAT